MPKLGPNEQEERNRIVRAAIVSNMELYSISEDEIARRKSTYTYDTVDFNIDWQVLHMMHLIKKEEPKMAYGNSYRCDVCGCYLDPGEGRVCDDCMEKSVYSVQQAKQLNEVQQISRGTADTAGNHER